MIQSHCRVVNHMSLIYSPSCTASGIGRETVRVLAGAGAKVIMASRDLAAGQQVAQQLTQGELKVIKQMPSC